MQKRKKEKKIKLPVYFVQSDNTVFINLRLSFYK